MGSEQKSVHHSTEAVNNELALVRLKTLQREIDDRTNKFFVDYELPKILKDSKHSSDSFESLKEFSTRPSKKVRGAMAVVSYELFGGTNHDTAINLAVVIELFHNYLLIIDDIMDHSEHRRGGKTVHAQYLDMFGSKLETSEHLSNMLAVSDAMLLQHMAAGAFNDLDENSSRVLKAGKILNNNLIATGYGQIEDMFNGAEAQLSEDDILLINSLKSSYYTFVNPLQVGAVLAGKDNEKVEKIFTDFGVPAGIAFQLQDDIIGLFGDEKVSGKSHLDDLKEGKMTVLIRKTLNEADEKDTRFINSVLGNASVTEQDRQEVIQIVKNTGSLDYVEHKIEKAIDSARRALDVDVLPGDLKDFLGELLDYSMGRKW